MHLRSRVSLRILPVVILLAACTAESPEAIRGPHPLSDYSIVPAPRSLTPRSGSFGLSGTLTIATSRPGDPQLDQLAALLSGLLTAEAGVETTIESSPEKSQAAGAVTLSLERSATTESEADGGSEAYALEATSAGVTIRSTSHAGLFYGIQTLRQLITRRADGVVEIAAVEIEDAPRFRYRGMHLDVGRHFFPVEFVKRYIDLMAMYKMNTFHWHLTEDQGWRLEIEAYPRLTEVGSCRHETMVEKNFSPYVGDGEEYCGFYTREEAREVVEYAASRHVTVIPEIEMPGHSLAALAAYPEYACTDGPFEAATRWGVFSDIYCPTEETFAFLEDVLTEVLAIFPSRYIHIGGDEAPKRRWQESAEAQAVIRREGLADEHELQSYFIRRIEAFLLENGRRLIGWDEILEGGLAPEATVMSWRGTEGGIEAARQGHDVVMTPVSHAYFDYYQGPPEHEPLAIGGFLPLERVYGFEPVPDELTPEQASYVLGAQANVWTEYMKTPERVEYMAYPRVLAMSEVVWSPRDDRDWEDFQRRLPAHYHRLEAMGVNYRIPPVAGLEHDRLSLDGRFTVGLQSPIPEAAIHYTLDGSEPTATSPRYSQPLELEADWVGTEVRARLFSREGRPGTLRRARFRRTDLRPAQTLDPGGLTPGLDYSYIEYDQRVSSVDQLVDSEPTARGKTEGLSLAVAGREEGFGLVFEGYLAAPEDGIYTFSLTSDDGSRFLIGDRVVVDNDGIHGVSKRSGTIALAAGPHPVIIRYFQRGGDRELALETLLEGAETGLDSAGLLFRSSGEG